MLLEIHGRHHHLYIAPFLLSSELLFETVTDMSQAEPCALLRGSALQFFLGLVIRESCYSIV